MIRGLWTALTVRCITELYPDGSVHNADKAKETLLLENDLNGEDENETKTVVKLAQKKAGGLACAFSLIPEEDHQPSCLAAAVEIPKPKGN
jgi:hypothetical protein